MINLALKEIYFLIHIMNDHKYTALASSRASWFFKSLMFYREFTLGQHKSQCGSSHISAAYLDGSFSQRLGQKYQKHFSFQWHWINCSLQIHTFFGFPHLEYIKLMRKYYCDICCKNGSLSDEQILQDDENMTDKNFKIVSLRSNWL